MNYRKINTNFWLDDYISELNDKEIKVFLFYFTNEKVNMCGIYELPMRYAVYCLNMEKTEIEEIKKKFEADSKYCYYNSWVYIANNYKHNQYSTNKFVISSYVDSFNAVPLSVRKYFLETKALSHIPPFNLKKIKYSFSKEMEMVIEIEKEIEIEKSLGGSLSNNTDVNNMEDVKKRLQNSYDGSEDVDPDSIPF